jgi:hypothetical protein
MAFIPNLITHLSVFNFAFVCIILVNQISCTSPVIKILSNIIFDFRATVSASFSKA